MVNNGLCCCCCCSWSCCCCSCSCFCCVAFLAFFFAAAAAVVVAVVVVVVVEVEVEVAAAPDKAFFDFTAEGGEVVPSMMIFSSSCMLLFTFKFTLLVSRSEETWSPMLLMPSLSTPVGTVVAGVGSLSLLHSGRPMTQEWQKKASGVCFSTTPTQRACCHIWQPSHWMVNSSSLLLPQEHSILYSSSLEFSSSFSFSFSSSKSSVEDVAVPRRVASWKRMVSWSPLPPHSIVVSDGGSCIELVAVCVRWGAEEEETADVIGNPSSSCNDGGGGEVQFSILDLWREV